jgi:uncharacterized protein (TIGR03067 family)
MKTFVAAIMLAGFAGPTQEQPPDMDRLQGTWKVKVAKTGRATQEREMVAAWTYTFKGELLILNVDGRPADRLRCRLDESKKPKQIDMLAPNAADPDAPLLGIYAIDGNTLKLSWSKIDGKFRPTSFDLPPGENVTRQVSLVLERVKK